MTSTERHISSGLHDLKLLTDPARIASATFAFSHPSNFSVSHPVRPGTGAHGIRICVQAPGFPS